MPGQIVFMLGIGIASGGNLHLAVAEMASEVFRCPKPHRLPIGGDSLQYDWPVPEEIFAIEIIRGEVSDDIHLFIEWRFVLEFGQRIQNVCGLALGRKRLASGLHREALLILEQPRGGKALRKS